MLGLEMKTKFIINGDDLDDDDGDVDDDVDDHQVVEDQEREGLTAKREAFIGRVSLMVTLRLIQKLFEIVETWF